jgi:hypothetical protein
MRLMTVDTEPHDFMAACGEGFRSFVRPRRKRVAERPGGDTISSLSLAYFKRNSSTYVRATWKRQD